MVLQIQTKRKVLLQIVALLQLDEEEISSHHRDKKIHIQCVQDKEGHYVYDLVMSMNLENG